MPPRRPQNVPRSSNTAQEAGKRTSRGLERPNLADGYELVAFIYDGLVQSATLENRDPVRLSPRRASSAQADLGALEAVATRLDMGLRRQRAGHTLDLLRQIGPARDMPTREQLTMCFIGEQRPGPLIPRRVTTSWHGPA